MRNTPQPRLVPTRADLVSLLPPEQIGAELGVFRGAFAERLLVLTRPRELHLIDTWSGSVQSGNKDGQDREWANLDLVYQHLVLLYQQHPVVRLHRGYTRDVLASFPDHYFDWVYIDADHRYLAVQQDLALARRKVKPGGAILGHDYESREFGGVVRAVNECGLPLLYLTRDALPSYWLEVPR